MQISTAISIIFLNLIVQSTAQNKTSLNQLIKEDITFNNSNKGSLEVMQHVISQRIIKDPQTYSFDEILKLV